MGVFSTHPFFGWSSNGLSPVFLPSAQGKAIRGRFRVLASQMKQNCRPCADVVFSSSSPLRFSLSPWKTLLSICYVCVYVCQIKKRVLNFKKYKKVIIVMLSLLTGKQYSFYLQIVLIFSYVWLQGPSLFTLTTQMHEYYHRMSFNDKILSKFSVSWFDIDH